MIFFRKIVGDSMSPTISDGSIAVVFKKKPKVNDIVVAHIDEGEVIKRISKLANKKVFLCGDNVSNSTDSRSYGYIAQSSIIGVVIYYFRFSLRL